MDAGEVQRLAKKAGVTAATLRRAMKEVGVEKEKVHGQDGRVEKWVWSLPLDALGWAGLIAKAEGRR
jgi:hypothetical protein